MKKIKLGFIGGGRHAEPAHIQKMLSIEEVEIVGMRDDGVSFSFANQYFLDDAKDNLEEIKIYLEKGIITLVSVGGSNEFKVYFGNEFFMSCSRDMNKAYMDVNKSFVYSVLGTFPTYISRKELSVSASVILMKLTDTLKF